MSVLWSSQFSSGGGGEFVATKSYPMEVISAGATGTFKTLSPPAGKRLKLTWFIGNQSFSSLTSVSVGGVTNVDAVLLQPDTTATQTNNRFLIFHGMNIILGNVDEDIAFSTNVATTGDIEFMYQEGN